MNPKMQESMNSQIAFEFESARLYLAMSAWFNEINLPGFAHWMRIQYKEELFHGEKMMDYMMERRGRPVVSPLPKPRDRWSTPMEAFQEAFAHEQIVSSRINDLVSLAMEIRDHATVNFLQWFVAEQVEEEASADKIIQQLTLNANQPAGLFMIDRELGTRVLALPVGAGATP